MFECFCDGHRRQTTPGQCFRPFTRFNPFCDVHHAAGKVASINAINTATVSVKTAGRVHQTILRAVRASTRHYRVLTEIPTPRVAPAFFQQRAVNGFLAGAQKRLRWKMPARVALPFPDAGSVPRR